ncbi:replicative DNA helicase [Clostridium tyrobutyricum]|uniref:replicative DNA helicase n=1 Tax=Clostridium tyrobutyricum TaxID=1519 RepID=UPI001C38AB11|nr:replicative DNA helicase [Clostridium tyrobutyricum]MBV4417451.1 replicative DNA helicase [Clostridium tyrobutyricum]
MNTYNLDSERNLLGSILINQDSLCDCIDLIKPDDFFENRNKLIYSSIVDLYTNSKDVNITTVAERLGANLRTAGGITYISELIGQTLINGNVRSYVELIKKYSNTRMLLRLLQKDITKIEKTDVNIENILKELQDFTLQLGTNDNLDDGKIDGAMEKVLNNLEDRYKNGGAIQGIETGFKKLDRTLNGLNKTDFIILGARPSMGKTAFALNIGLGTLRTAKVSFFSLEMSKEQLLERAISSKGLINNQKIKTGKLEDEEWARISEVSARIVTSNLKIYDQVYSLNGIKAECKKRKIQEGLDIVIIDYLTLIDGAEKSDNRVQEISKISRQLKLMAKELDIVVIALAQLSRAPEVRTDHRPNLSDLRESGSIEQDADTVIFLYRDQYYNPDTDEKDILEAIIAKQRNGEVGTIKLKWLPEYQRITDIYMGGN